MLESQDHWCTVQQAFTNQWIEWDGLYGGPELGNQREERLSQDHSWVCLLHFLLFQVTYWIQHLAHLKTEMDRMVLLSMSFSSGTTVDDDDDDESNLYTVWSVCVNYAKCSPMYYNGDTGGTTVNSLFRSPQSCVIVFWTDSWVGTVCQGSPEVEKVEEGPFSFSFLMSFLIYIYNCH